MSDTKGQLLYDSTDVRHLEAARAQGQKGEEWGPEAEGRADRELFCNSGVPTPLTPC